jgi:signal peptidase I
MIAVIWQDFKGLVWRPRESLEAILTRHSALVSLLLGTLAYYLSTLQLSEILSPSYLGEMTYFLVNFPLAFGRMACTTFLIHLACRVIVRNQGEWWDLLSMWGYTQVPTIFLAALALVFLVTAPLASRAGAGILWWFSVIGIAFFLSLWGLILQIQTLRVCYNLDGRQLLAVGALALLFLGILAGLEKMFLYDRGLVPRTALAAMEPTAPPSMLGRNNIALPFDILTYHLKSPEQGEIVGFVPPHREGLVPFMPMLRLRSVGRVVGLPGDKVAVLDGRLSVGDRAVSDPYGLRMGPPATHYPPTIVPEGHFFILGDNRALPLEAYGGGIIPQAAIRGRLTDVGRLKWRLAVGTWLW